MSGIRGVSSFPCWQGTEEEKERRYHTELCGSQSTVHVTCPGMSKRVVGGKNFEPQNCMKICLFIPNISALCSKFFCRDFFFGFSKPGTSETSRLLKFQFAISLYLSTFY